MARVNLIDPRALTDQHLIAALDKHDWFLLPTARHLGMGRVKLLNLLKKHGINYKPKPKGAGRKDLDSQYKKHKSYKKALNTWRGMKKRCQDPKEPCYKDYGGRGIKISKSWLKFDQFFSDCIKKENAFRVGYSIDRVNNNGNYTNSNTRFASHKTQCNNRRTNKFYVYKGQKKTLAQLADQYGFTWEYLRDRIKLGFTIKEAIEIPRYGRRKK
jgi:hypothetical protein